MESAQRAADLCRQMLAYSGRGRFVVEPLDLSRAVRDLAALLQTSVSRKAALSLELADGLPPVLADASQVRQVVLNLVVNASEALGERPASSRCGPAAPGATAAPCAAPAFDDDLPEGEYVFLGGGRHRLRHGRRDAAAQSSSRSSRPSSPAAGWGWRRCWASCAATTAPSS